MIKTSIKIYNTLRNVVSKVYHKLNLEKYETPKGRKEIISNIDALTLTLFKQSHGIATKKSLFEIIAPKCSYKTLVVSINRTLEILKRIITYLAITNRAGSHIVKHVDSTDLPVSSLRKSRYHKTMKTLATYSKSSKGWFYGLKLHLSVDLKGKIVAIHFTTGNKSEREILKNMNKIATFDGIELLKTRMRIEDHFGNLKQFHNLTSTVCRSIKGYLTNYLSSVLAYMIA